MHSITNKANLKQEKASISLEAALALPIFLLVFLQLGLSLYAVEAELAVFSSMQRIAKESNLILSAQRQLSGTDEESASRLKAVVKDTLSTQLGSRLLEERLAVWKTELYENPLAFQMVQNGKVYFQTPQRDALGRLKLFYEIPGLWERLSSSQTVLLNDWRGDKAEGSSESEEGKKNNEQEDYWSWDNFSRGQAFISKYGGNLSRFHPVVAKNDAGHVTMIKSMDLTAVTYQSKNELKRTLEEQISDLKEFQGSAETGPIQSKKCFSSYRRTVLTKIFKY